MLAYRNEKMKQINNFILEKLHLDKDIEINKTSSEKKYKSKDGMFIALKSIRNSEDFSFTPGEKVLLMRYTTSGYQAQVRDIFEINKVNKNTISLKSDESFYANMKFDIKGIYVVKPTHHMAAAIGRHIDTIVKVAKIFNIPVEIITR